MHKDLRRLKLVTGVDISTRPVRRSGREGKAKKKRSLRKAEEEKRMAFRRSITMFSSPRCMVIETYLLEPCEELDRARTT